VTELLRDVARALVLIVGGDREVWDVTAVSLQISLIALGLGAVTAIPVGYGLLGAPRRLREIAHWILHTLTALPTVGVGLGLYFILSASGPLGWMSLLYTKIAMIVGQYVLAFPIIASLVLTALRRVPSLALDTAETIGLRGWRRMFVLLGEVRLALISAMMLAFARVFTELGAAMILGGNIRGQTRTLTTVIALEHDRGDEPRAIALGLILVMIALALNGVVHAAKGRERV